MKWLVGLVLGLMLLWSTPGIGAEIPAPPWKTFSEMLSGHITGQAMEFCANSPDPPGIVTIVVVRVESYEMTLVRTGRQFLLVYDPAPDTDSAPTHVSRGVYTGEDHDIPPLRWEPLTSTDPCKVLFPMTTPAKLDV